MATGKPIGSFYVQLGLNTKEFQKNLKGANRELQQAFGSSAIRTSELLAAAMAGLAVAVAGVAAASVKMAADLERQQVSFTRLMGSAGAAKERLQELQEFASKTPYTFTELVEYEKRLLALGFAASDTKELLTTIGDAASGLGMDAGGVGRIIKALGDIKSKGAVATQELNQLGEAGINARQMLADALGKSMPETLKMVEDRAIDSATAITAITTGINKQFGGMMAMQAETMLGMWSTVVDEGENVMRIIGKQITMSANLKAMMAQLRQEAQDFRVVLEDQGFSAAFNNLFGTKAKLAIAAVAGAITGALIPAVVSLGISVALAGGPLTIIMAVGAAAGVAGGALYVMGDKMKAGMNIAKEAAVSALTVVKNGVLIVINEITSAVKEALAKLAGLIAQSAAGHYLTYMAKGFQDLANSLKESAIEDAGNAELMESQNAVLKERLSVLWEAYNTGTDWVNLMNSLGASNIVSAYDKVASSIERIRNSMLKTIGIASFFNNIIGQGKNATAPAASGGGTKSTGKSDAEKLAEEAQRTSESIQQTWMQQTQSKSAQLDFQHRKEVEELEKSKAYNKNYRRDMQMLDETYYQRKTELLRDAADQEAKTLVEVAQSRASYNKEQIEAEWAEAEAHAQRLQAVQEGAALEATLQADMQAADLAAYVEHLNEKQMAFRAHLEGQRNLIEVYDQLQKDAHRSNASYMAEGYRTIYYGLSDALTNVVTGAKNAGEAFKELGMQIIQMVVKWQIQRRLAAMMSQSLEATQVAASTAMAAATAAAWAPAAAMVAAATFGASTASAAAGLTGLSALSRALAVPGLADGGLVTRPTLAMIGEGGESEAVIPLSRMKDFAGGGEGANVQLNVINQTGQPVQATSRQHTDGGKIVVDLFLEGYSRNVSGIQDIVGRR